MGLKNKIVSVGFTLKAFSVGTMALATLIATVSSNTQAIEINYGEALQKSIYFYEAQQSGPIPAWNRTSWRGDSGMSDGADQGVNLLGGWYDAGDHVKFGFPMAASSTLLAWGVVDYPSAYQQTGQLEHIKNNLRFVADYFVAAHTAPNELWGQVGAGTTDHAWWGPAEVMKMQRPSYKIDASCPGSDLAGETAAALAAISMVFADSDSSYANNLLTHARQLYAFADNYRGKYSDCITDATNFYNSWSGYNDELVWGALWLYRATGDSQYLNKAIAGYADLSTEPQSTIKSFKWGHAWDDKGYGSYVLLARLTGDATYRADAERWLDFWTTGYDGNRINYTPGGLAFLDTWGPNRYAANTAFIALVYSDYLSSAQPSSSKAQTYYNFAVDQIEYILGDNPLGISYQIGYGNNYPSNPHHRTAHGSWNDSIQEPVQSRHLLIGALVGGPDQNDNYEDDRGDYVSNEVATDYNAAFTSALARLWLDFGGNPIAESQFPPQETRGDEYFVEAKVNSSGTRHIEIAAMVHNHSAWPAKSNTNLHFRYWIDLNAEFNAGYSLSDITVSTAYSQASGISDLQPWGDAADNIYYADVSFAGVDIYPGGQSASKKEVQFRFSLPTNSNNPEWDNSEDPSWGNFTNAYQRAPGVALYAGNELVWGAEPGPGCGATSGINCVPVAESQNVTTQEDEAVAITLSGSDRDGSISAYHITSNPQSGSLSGSGANRTYTPAPGFTGTDSFQFSVEDNSGAESAPATVTIVVNSSGTEPPPNGDVSCSIGNMDIWNTGFVLNNVTVENNTSSAISNWQVTLTFDTAINLSNGWNGEFSLSSDGRVMTVSNTSHNGNLAPGASASFGFQGGHNGNVSPPVCASN